MTRPAHLPDFKDPPLDEVVLGVQFEPVPGFCSVHTKEVMDLYRDDYPKVQEQPLLQPQFETFGGANLQPSFQFQVGAGPVGSRLWFVSEEENHLLQFQPDRFLTNWRKNPNLQPYPRFEGIAEVYRSNLTALATHFSSCFSYEMDINQAEVTYINILPVADFSEAGKWFSLWGGGALNIEGLNTSFSEVIRDQSDKPFARLFHAIQSVYTIDGKHKAFNLSLTFRGKPASGDLASAAQFLAAGREAIVMRFKEITTAYAHDQWGMK